MSLGAWVRVELDRVGAAGFSQAEARGSHQFH